MHPAFAELRQKQAPPSTPRSHPRGRGIADLAELGTGGAAHEPNVWSGGGPVNQPQLYDAALYAEPAAQQSSSIAAQPIAITVSPARKRFESDQRDEYSALK